MFEHKRTNERGMTLIELLIVVAIIGILSAIAAFNYLSALDKSKQKRSASDIRAIALAWESYAADQSTYNPAGYSFPATTASYGEMSAALVPRYIQNLPELDAWGTPFEYGFDGNTYAIRSLGKDGIADSDYTSVDLTDPDTDIVFSEGVFVVYPTGAGSGG